MVNKPVDAPSVSGQASRSSAKTAKVKLETISEEKYQAFIRNSNEGIWLFELDKPIPIKFKPATQIRLMYERAYLAEANDAMAAMYGYASAKSLIGLRLSDLMVRSDARNTEYLTAFIDSGYRLSGVESHEIDRNGDDKFFRNSLVGVVEDGKLIRAWGTQQDVTEKHKSDEELRRSEARLALALEASNTGTWEWNVKTNELIWSKELKRLFGLKASYKITYDGYLKFLHPDDRKTMNRIIRNAMKTGESYRVEHRAVWPDGSIHWILGQGQALFKGGRPVRMIGTSSDIDDIKRSQHRTQELEQIAANLKEQRAQLVALNNAKNEFITLASHQLRTPASGVKQYLGMIIEGYVGQPTEEELGVIMAAYESNERQLKIVDDLLNVAKVDSGEMKLAKGRHDICQLVDDIVAEQQGAFKNRKQEINVRHPKYPIRCMIDLRLMRMALENLIDNAGKYTPPKKIVSVSVAKIRDRLVINVKDHGVGIKANDQKRLFQKFSRIDNPLSASVGGTGLGLYLAKRIIDLHGGDIKVRSKINDGSTFIVKLPV